MATKGTAKKVSPRSGFTGTKNTIGGFSTPFTMKFTNGKLRGIKKTPKGKG